MKQQENRAEPQEKQIRFIDSHYNLKFYIPDGGKIRITFRDGHTADRVCKYIDDYHLYVGNCCYHICEFAEKMELSGSKVEPINQSEPSKKSGKLFSYLGGGSDEAVKNNRGNNEKKEPAMQEQR